MVAQPLAEPDVQVVAQPAVASCSKGVAKPPSHSWRSAKKKRKVEEANLARNQFFEKKLELSKQEKEGRIELLMQEKEARMEIFKQEKEERIGIARLEYGLRLEEHKLKMENLKLENELLQKEIVKVYKQ